MDKTVAGVIGVVTALAGAAPASAAPVTRVAAMQADSYRALLAPIPNALALLREGEGTAASEGGVQQAQYYPYGYPPPPPPYAPGYYAYPYWHHHHHHWYRPRYHHHHHHHHWRGW